jgi:DNA (cytosine-5)-methyltransferase 1
MLRAIQEIKPTWVIAENVFGIVNIDGGMVFEQVCLDLENEGYEVQPFIIPAAAKNAPHRRDRCWFIAQNTLFSGCIHGGNEQKGTEVREFGNTCTGSADGIYLSERNAINSNSKRFKRSLSTEFIGQFPNKTNKPKVNILSNGTRGKKLSFTNFPTQSPICGGDDGLPTELDGITFSKWRAESIKGYGNAIVPQVVYEIFQAIEKSLL